MPSAPATSSPPCPGQTIEIINTDAEGRLVLADVLWYVQDRFKPKFMIDLATLTGAILVALAQEYAGPVLQQRRTRRARLIAAGKATGERVWRMPLGPEFDKMIDSKFADMKNTGGRFGGSSTAAQFLQRFVNDVPWAHLDIAGTAMGSPQSEINKGWARAGACGCSIGSCAITTRDELSRAIRGRRSASPRTLQAEVPPDADVLFYHLQRQPLEAVLPTLLQKTRERGWRAVVRRRRTNA